VDNHILEIKETLAGLSESMRAMQRSIGRIEKLDEKQTRILELLAANKTEHEAMQHDISVLRDRTHKLAGDVQVAYAIQEKLRRHESRLDDQERRIEEVERSLPVISLSSGWVFKAALAVIGLLATSAVGVIIHWLVGGFK